MARKLPAADAAEVATPSAASLAALTALGALAALWSTVLWGELVRLRATGSGVCAFGGGTSCAQLWDGRLASAVHRTTGVPLPGWGVLWGLMAAGLALVALLRRAEAGDTSPWLVACRLTAAAGLVSAAAFAVAGALEGGFCAGCFANHMLVAGYAGIALFGWPGVRWQPAGAALARAALFLFGGFALVLYPGRQTPRPAAAAGREAVTQAASAPTAAPGSDTPEAALAEMVQTLSPELKQALSDSLMLYGKGRAQELPAPRQVLGPPAAPVRLTAFTDVLCDHCADLHQTFATLRQHLPEGSFAIESRQLPLDGQCNALVTEKSKGESVRCLAARVVICAEGAGAEKAYELQGALFAEQKSLTPEKVRALAAPAVPGLAACLQDAATEAKLQEDVRLAAAYEPEGTPLVLVNGRQGTSFGPFLYAMVLTGGTPEHPAFASLPAPNPNPHIH